MSEVMSEVSAEPVGTIENDTAAVIVMAGTRLHAIYVSTSQNALVDSYSDDQGQTWQAGTLNEPFNGSGSEMYLAATSWIDSENTPHVRVYTTLLGELCLDGSNSWYTGDFNPGAVMMQPMSCCSEYANNNLQIWVMYGNMNRGHEGEICLASTSSTQGWTYGGHGALPPVGNGQIGMVVVQSQLHVFYSSEGNLIEAYSTDQGNTWQAGSLNAPGQGGNVAATSWIDSNGVGHIRVYPQTNPNPSPGGGAAEYCWDGSSWNPGDFNPPPPQWFIFAVRLDLSCTCTLDSNGNPNIWVNFYTIGYIKRWAAYVLASSYPAWSFKQAGYEIVPGEV